MRIMNQEVGPAIRACESRINNWILASKYANQEPTNPRSIAREEGNKEEEDRISREKVADGDGCMEEDHGIAVTIVLPRAWVFFHTTWVGGEIPSQGGWNHRDGLGYKS